MKYYDLTSQRGCMVAVLDMRHSCLYLVRAEDSLWTGIQLLERKVRLLRAGGHPMLLRRAAVLETRANELRADLKMLHGHMRSVGQKLVQCAPEIDAYIPQALQMDLLNVNPVDRSNVPADAGIVKIVFVWGLENSAEHRDDDWKNSPMFRAVQLAFMHEMIHNEELKARTDEMLFGHGGMFEFVPRYQPQVDGTMKRMAPPLRIADPNVDGRLQQEESPHGRA